MSDEKSVWLVDDLPESETVEQHGKDFPVVGAKLRLLREQYGHDAKLRTHLEDAGEDMVRYSARLALEESPRNGIATAHGTAHAGQERVGDNNLHELAETRAIARCLRFAGYAVDAADASEVRGRNRGDGSAHDDGNPHPAGTPDSSGPEERTVFKPDSQPVAPEAIKRLQGAGWEYDDEQGHFWKYMSREAALDEAHERSEFGVVVWDGEELEP